MQSGIDPQVDYVFKRLFGSPETAGLRHALLNDMLSFPETRSVRETTLLNPITDREFAEEKVSIFDIRLTDQAGRRYFLEMQRKVVPWVFAKRALFYWAQLYGRQLKEGETHHTLSPTYGLCFLGERLVNDDRHHHVFQAADPGGAFLANDLVIHTVELNKFQLAAEEIKTPLDRWCYFLKHGANLDREKLPVSLDVPVIHQALEVLMKVSQDEIEFHRYDSRMKTLRDIADWEYAATHGEELAQKLARERHEEGLEKGREQGELIGEIHALQRGLKQPLTAKQELYQLSVVELRQLAQRLQQQAAAGSNGAP